ncbi:DUF4974 domain-containing protein [Balneolales bacterium ANBcel1]|nr:DUF4974 domain-containing protein [Balneolales bacterium ANBcel1]
MNEKDIHWNDLIRYVNGEMSGEELRKTEEWIQKDPENSERLAFVKRIYALPAEERGEWDADAAWERFRKKHPEVDTRRKPLIGTSSELLSRRLRAGNSRYRWIAAAASILFVAMAALFLYNVEDEPVREEVTEVTYKEFFAQPGSRTRLTLSDGSRAILKPGSRLVLPESFRGLEDRVVELEGEAFFEVEPEPGKTFIVKTEKTITRVLGTRFNVSSYPEDDFVSVAVISGVVSLEGRRDDAAVPARISGNHLGIYTPEGVVEVSELSDMSKYLGWIEGELVFQQEPLDRVALELQRWYNISIEIDPEKPELYEKKLTSSFRQNQPVREVIEAVSLTLNISFTEKNGSFYFTE